ncbi:CaiB/BaiF CoA transferase family protein [Orrella marina]|uniref:CoA transferase n=1 Tax=Orrella marina TaxID=2163011 RepID=A0A2R4XFD3_9BURK|nr:CoA transferase [Orrella marina]AWB32517.1 CoA transferase [Orrella marina]
MTSPQYPLEGITVLDLGQVYQGPYCGFLLAMAGARVIKIEPPHGDSVRSRAENTNGNSLAFSMLNSNKEGIVLDLKTGTGRELLLRLVEKADVLVQNFAPGVMDKLGVGYDVLKERNNRLIYASGSGYGSSGPYRDYLAMDLTVQAIGGIMSVTGFEDGPPVKAGAAVSDFLGGSHLYGAIMTALFHRERTGEGSAVETAMFDMCYHPLASNLSMTHLQGRLIPRTGNRHGGLSVVPYNVYPAKDGYIAIICVKDAHWKALCRTMGREELATDPRYAINKERAARIDEVDKIISEWSGTLEKEEIFTLSQKEKFPAAPVRDLYELSSDPHLHERGALQNFDHPILGPIVLPHSPIRFTHLALKELRVNPNLGEHTQAVLEDLLNIDEDQMRQYRHDGAFGS